MKDDFENEDLTDELSEFTAEKQPVNVSNEQLLEVSNLGLKMYQLQVQVNRIEELLKEKKEQLAYVEFVELPEAMDRIKMAQFRLITGQTISVSPFLKLSYQKDRIDEIDQWLRKAGHRGIVKRQLVVVIPREDDPIKAKPIIEAAKKSGYAVEDKKNIHPQTLNKWGRELNEQGEVIPEDLFNVYRGRQAKLS